MGQPITTKSTGICFAFPDVCLTPAPPSPSPVPIPYPNIGQLQSVQSEAGTVLVGGNPVVTSNSEIPTTTGDEAGSASPTKGKVQFVTFSQSVFAEGHNVVRMFDTTTQNGGNAVGQVLGGVPNVLVGG
jgi:hypothetical protein